MPAPASVARRFAAGGVDLLTAFTPCWLITPLLVGLLTSGGAETRVVFQFVLLLNLFVSALTLLARPVAHHLTASRSLGQRLMRVQVLTSDGQPLGLLRVIARQGCQTLTVAACVLSGLYPLLVVPALWGLVDTRGRMLHDLICRTYVAELSADGGQQLLPGAGVQPEPQRAGS